MILKNFIHISSCLLLLCLFTSCSDLIVDPCESKLCYNGGFCDDGNCVCANGYSGEDCQIPPAESCITNNTGIICIRNGSRTGKTFDVILDGVRVAILNPGDEHCQEATFGPHPLYFRATNTNDIYCNGSPNVIRCSVIGVECGS